MVEQRKMQKNNYNKNRYPKNKSNESYEHGRRTYDAASEDNLDECLVYGRNSVRELLKSERTVDKLYIAKGVREDSISYIAELAIEKKIPIVEVEKQKLDNMCRGANHQSVAAMAAAKDYSSIEDIIEIAHQRGQKPLVVILDGIEDPHNLGAIIRTAECCGVHGVIIPKHRCATLNSVVAKTSAGALEYMAIAKETNIAMTIEKLKKAGFWVFGAEAGGESYYDADFDVPCAIVLGSEGKGISRLVKEKCDYIVSIPLYGQINSLNVSAAAAVIISEAARQHNKQ